jgi:hypothetical protein
MVSAVLAFVLGNYFGPIVGFLILFVGVGFGGLWEGRHLSGLRLFDKVPPPVISKPIAFIGYALIGVFWGSVATEIFGSVIAGILLLATILTVVAVWVSVISKRYDFLKHIGLAAISLFLGFGSVYALGLAGV